MSNQSDSNKELIRVLTALRTLCDIKCSSTTLPPQSLWPKTRHIADYCGMDIYTSRRYLMKLAKSKKAYMSDGSINNSLRWHIAPPTPAL
ncbi:FaeA/PapI family transcriptional regulator [Serratia aquatilis]|uniref:FaeA/PapI family transcriptional regulator n=1 Tax=Serratia aquatilis TaxID=1737515 RepID=A0ABV6EEP0_9GAMM